MLGRWIQCACCHTSIGPALPDTGASPLRQCWTSRQRTLFLAFVITGGILSVLVTVVLTATDPKAVVGHFPGSSDSHTR